MKKNFYLLIVFFSIFSSQALSQSRPYLKQYLTSGYFFHPTVSRPLAQVKRLSGIDDHTYEAQLGDVGYYFKFKIDASNHLTDWVATGITPAAPASGFMTEDNSGAFTYYPDTTEGFVSSAYNNTYDPITHTFYMHYGYNDNGDSGQATFSRQVYEKWVLAPFPVVVSHYPGSGTLGDTVTIKGLQFTNATAVTFGSEQAASFSVKSDSIIKAVVGEGQGGFVDVYNSYGQNDDSISFTYLTPLVKDSLWRATGNAGFSNANASYVSMAFDTSGIPYVVFADGSNGNKATAMKLGTNNTWKAVGTPSDEAASYTNIAIGNDNLPVIAYEEVTNKNNITVQKFDGTAWQYLSAKGFAGTVQYTTNNVALAINKNNIPFVVSVYAQNNKWLIKVLQYNGASWDYLPDAGFISQLGDASIAIDQRTNDVYLVSDDAAHNSQLIVRKFSFANNSWSTVGTPGFTNAVNGIYYPDIALDSAGVPIVSAQIDDGSEKTSLYKFDGNDWKVLGDAQFTPGHTHNTSLAIKKDNNPIVLFSDKGYNDLGTVMFLSATDTLWHYAGARGIGGSTYYTQNAVAVSKNGVPYIAFADMKYNNRVTVLHLENYEELNLRMSQGLYSEGGSTACHTWQKQYPDWTNFISTDNSGSHLEMQTQFQDEPGSICGYQSFIADTAVLKDTFAWTGKSEKEYTSYFLRNYKVSFSNSPFPHPAGIRLFCTTAELTQFLSGFNRRHGGTAYTANQMFVIRYDGPNEDYLLDNNEDKGTDYTRITPSVHFYGPNDEYCYFEFYTDRFSEFRIALSGNFIFPLTLLNLSATIKNNTGFIHWQTANDVNTSSFIVQRSLDGVHFTNIGKVNAADGTGSHNYNYKDDLTAVGNTQVFYYRLQTTDKEGNNTRSNVVVVRLFVNNLIAIQPNPAQDYFTVVNKITGISSVVIADINGKTILEKKNVTNNDKVSISMLAKGVYVLKIYYSGNTVFKKLVIE